MIEVNDKAYTIRLDAERKRHGRFKKGDIPWNKGMSWKEQGISDEEHNRRISILMATTHKNGYSHKPAHTRPVIQMDDDGNRVHWYVSSEEAGRRVGCSGRNIRKVCNGERPHAKGFCWKWDDRF